MFGLLKKCFVNLLTSIVSASDHTRCALLNNQKCMTHLLLLIYVLMSIGKKLFYYSFAGNLDKFAGSCNTLDELSSGVCVQIKQKI